MQMTLDAKQIRQTQKSKDIRVKTMKTMTRRQMIMLIIMETIFTNQITIGLGLGKDNNAMIMM